MAGDSSTSPDENVGLDLLNPAVKVHQEWIGRSAGLRSSTGNGQFVWIYFVNSSSPAHHENSCVG